MLSSERYQASLNTLGLMVGKSFRVEDETRHLLFSEQLATQRALQALGATVNTPPSKLPLINEIISPSSEWLSKGITVVEIGGMPRAGKTSFVSSLNPEKFIISEERYRTIKELLTARARLPNLKISYPEEKPIVFDRWQFDLLPFARANFILGRISGSRFWKISQSYQIPPAPIQQKEIQMAFILCLVHPSFSLSRAGQHDKSGRFINSQFLSVFYEQYLRLHQEIISGNRSFYYACLDLSNQDTDTNQRILEDTFLKVLAKMG